MDDSLGFYEVSTKEKAYFAVRLIVSVVLYALIIAVIGAMVTEGADGERAKATFLIPAALFFFLLYILRNGLFIGLIKSFSVKLGEKQLPEVYKIVSDCSYRLGIKRTPNVYLLQAGGSLNAFSKKFFNSNYVVIYSDLLEAYYQGDKDAVEFVIAHELGHIKRNHFIKELFLAPSAVVPFLAAAYYRGCELTCDNIGKFFNPKGALSGLLMLAGGKVIYRELNLEAYINQEKTDASFWRWLVEKFLSHPNLYKRLLNVYDPTMVSKFKVSASSKPYKYDTSEVLEKIVDADKADYSRYMPK
ncbi:MAG: M48 family metallopeptidase [Bacteroidales bacterium]|nr:M48 family metallopeptidase [Bacteroidales bacterium]MBN2747925.1 M48 family metallopeptidase [Bacteroidales bacterium]